MNKEKLLKRNKFILICVSIFNVFILFALLCGATYAWFESRATYEGGSLSADSLIEVFTEPEEGENPAAKASLMMTPPGGEENAEGAAGAEGETPDEGAEGDTPSEEPAQEPEQNPAEGAEGDTPSEEPSQEPEQNPAEGAEGGTPSEEPAQ